MNLIKLVASPRFAVSFACILSLLPFCSPNLVSAQPLPKNPNKVFESPRELRGQVLDANDFVLGVVTPVSGARVSILNTDAITTTDSQGYFILQGVPEGRHSLDIDTSQADLAPDGSPYASFREKLALIEKQTIVERPFYLPRIDLSSLTPVDPSQTTVVTNSNLNISLSIPPNTAKDQQGLDFQGEISISEVPNALAPAPLPDTLEPGLLITIQPVGVTFDAPVPITFPNVDNLAVGTEANIWSLDPDTGIFKIVGTVTAQPDGTLITTSGGIRAADWHAALPPSLTPGENDDGGDNNDCDKDCKPATGSNTSLKSGALIINHTLPSYRTKNQRRSLKLVYNSLNANPAPIIGIDSVISDLAAVPPKISATLDINGIVKSTYVDSSNLNSGLQDAIRQAFSFDATALTTGIYPYNIRLTSHYTESNISRDLSDDIIIRNELASPFGVGWSIEGLDRLIPQPNGDILLLRGDGGTVKFEREPDDLSEWQVEGPSSSSWALSSDNRSVTQQFNTAGQTFFVGPTNEIDTNFKAKLKAGANGDDDYIGIVMGYNSPIGGDPNEFDLILFDWKQKSQNFAGSLAPEGMSLVKIKGNAFDGGIDFWQHTNTDEFELLATNWGAGTGWQDDVEYELDITYEKNRILVKVDKQTIFDVPGVFPSGRFGFYNFSQEDVLYEIITEEAPFELYRNSAGEFSTLRKNPDNTYQRTLKNGTQINYNQDGYKTSSVDKNGNTTTYQYSANLLTKMIDPVGAETNLSYGPDGLLETITDPALRVVTLVHDANKDLVKIIDPDLSEREFSYDAKHLMQTQISKRDFTTSYNYDFAGRNIQANLPDTSTRKVSPAITKGLVDPQSGLGTDNNPAPPVKTNELIAKYTDGNQNETLVLLDNFGAPTQVTDPLLRVTQITRDAHSNPTQIVRPNSAVTSMSYDSRANMLSFTQEDIQATTLFSYDPIYNQVTTITRPENDLTTFNYDAQGNLTQIIDDAGTITAINYNDPNCPGQFTSITSALGLIEETATNFDYDPTTCNLLKVTDSLQRETNFTYTPAGNIETITDGESKLTTYIYDELNRVVETIDHDNNSTFFDYDPAGNLEKLTDANQNETNFEYDSLNRVKKITDALSNFESFTYDSHGNLKTVTTRNNELITYNYDAANQLFTKILPQNSITTYDYDLNGNLESVIDPDSALGFTYDLADRLKTSSTQGSPSQPEVTLTFDYDKNSNRKSLEDPLGITTYIFDNLNRLEKIINPSNKEIDFDYDPLNRRKRITFPNDIISDFTYDSQSQLKTLSHSLNASTLSSFSYEYNLVGNRKELDTLRVNLSVNTPLDYLYDDLHQLTQATHPTQPLVDENYAYDPLGNRLGNTTHDAANRLLSDQNFTYTYDDNGNLIQKTNANTTSTYHYDAENRLVSINLPNKQLNFKYDGLGRRIQKQVGSKTTTYIYDGEDILLEYDKQNNLTTRYTHGPGIDEPLISQQDLNQNSNFDSTENFYYHTDALGSITDITNHQADIIKSYVYDSFGNIVQESPPTPNSLEPKCTLSTPCPPISKSFTNPYTYTAREYDPESKLYYYRARYYDSSIGRFISEDPIGFNAGDVNFYRYVVNMPVNLIDPKGLAPDSDGPFLPDKNRKPPGWNPGWPTGVDDRGDYSESPGGTRYYPHPDDKGHWDHYDYGDNKRYPPNSLKPRTGQKKNFKDGQNLTDPWDDFDNNPPSIFPPRFWNPFKPFFLPPLPFAIPPPNQSFDCPQCPCT